MKTKRQHLIMIALNKKKVAEKKLELDKLVSRKVNSDEDLTSMQQVLKNLRKERQKYCDESERDYRLFSESSSLEDEKIEPNQKLRETLLETTQIKQIKSRHWNVPKDKSRKFKLMPKSKKQYLNPKNLVTTYPDYILFILDDAYQPETLIVDF